MTNIIPLRAFNDNYIWTLQQNDSIWVVDPGDAQPVIDLIRKSNLKLSGIFLTHHHADHSGGVLELIDYMDDVNIYANHNSPLKNISNPVKNNDEIQCGALRFKALEVPGHTLDHTAYYANQILFSGDTLFSAGCGRVFEGTVEQMYASLQILKQLPDETRVYCGHEYTLDNLNFALHVEPHNQTIKNKIDQVKKLLHETGCSLPSTIQEEKIINPFLRCDEDSIIEAVEKHSGKKLNSAVDVFKFLREWKNHF